MKTFQSHKQFEGNGLLKVAVAGNQWMICENDKFYFFARTFVIVSCDFLFPLITQNCAVNFLKFTVSTRNYTQEQQPDLAGSHYLA